MRNTYLGVNSQIYLGINARSSCRHADFQKAKCLILRLFINQLPGRPLL